MANYFNNEDIILRNRYGRASDPASSISGIQYHVVEDLEDEPVDIDFFKDHIRVDWSTDDNLLESYLKSSRQYLENWSQLSFGSKTMKLTALRLPANYKLMFGPIDSVTGYDNVGDTMLNPMLVNVSIAFTTKWESLPEAIKIAICKHAAWDYMVREKIATTEKGNLQEAKEFYDESQKLLLPYRNVTFC